jgi:hypothetical protein
MRELLAEEMSLIVGGEIPIEDPVFGVGGYNNDPYVLAGGGGSAPPPTSSGSQNSPGGGGGSGHGMTGYAAGAYKHTTRGGHKYSLQMRISDAQSKVLDAIVDYGYAHGATQQAITIAAEQAFYESSIGVSEKNPTSSATGLYEYMPNSWSEGGYAGSITDDNAQIVAIYSDIAKFQQRYTDGQASNQIPSTMSYSDYFEVKHHFGNNATNFTDPVIGQYNDAALTLSFHSAGQ